MTLLRSHTNNIATMTMRMVMLGNVAVAVAAISSLTFFDRNFGYPQVVASASAVITTRDQQQQQQQQQLPANITSSNGTTPSPSSDKPMPKLCEHQPWLELCQPWFISSIAPTADPSTLEPTTTEPTLFPSVDFTVEMEIVDISNNATTNDFNSFTNNNSTDANNSDASSPSIVQASVVTSNNTGTNNNNSNNNITSDSLNTNSSSTTTKISYKITPMDDTFLEVFRPKEVLGSKTKLKVDAEQEWKNDDTILRGEGGATPTKFVQLKFGLKQVLEEMSAMKKNAELDGIVAVVELIHAKLHLYALTSSSFGGYVTVVPSETKNNVGTAVSWNEESVVWSDYAKGGGGPGSGGGRDGKNLLPNDKNPELSRIGQVLADQWYEADVLDAILTMMKEEEVVNDDDDDDDDGIGKGNMNTNNLSSKMKSLSLRISTNSTDGVIYASKEHPSGNGPYLELRFVFRNFTNATTVTTTNVTTAPNSGTNNNATSNSHKPSTSPSTTIPVMERPFKPGEKNETDRTPIENSTTVLEDSVVNSTSVVSSSFRMTITVIESIRRGRNLASLLRRGRHENSRLLLEEEATSATQQMLQQPTLPQKEEPAVIEHLTRVYNEVLTIAPIDISLVYEKDLEVEHMNADESKRDAGGVIRTSVFRVMAVFDQPEVSTMLSNDAAKVLDEATIYAFVGPEEEEFIKVFKNTGSPIVDREDDAEYDVTVLKVKYSKADKEDVQNASSSNKEDSTSNATENTSSSSASWLNLTLIAGASAICLASSAAAILLWRQRRAGDYYSDSDPKKASDSPRSFSDATAPSTPSPTGFIMDRFKNKKWFDYAEFDDDGMDSENPSTNNAVVSPLTTDNHNQPFTTSDAHHQPTTNIKFPECQNVSFDDSSVSDVSSHVLGARSVLRVNPYGTQSESLLLDTSMESYNMEAMSALEQVRFDNVLDVDGYSLTSSGYTVGVGIVKVASEDTYGEDGSLSTGAVPSEMYSNLSMDDDSLVYSHDNNSSLGGGGSAAYAGHLFTLDMLRDKDKSLLVMPPPPSDVASESSSQKDDFEEDYDTVENNGSTTPVVGDIEHARGKNERESVSQSITNELSKVMQLLRSPYDDQSDDEGVGHVSVDESVMHIGTVAGHNTGTGEEVEDDAPRASLSNSTASEDDDCYDGLNVLMSDGLIVDDGEVDSVKNKEADKNSNHYLMQMNEAVSYCMSILDKAAQLQNTSESPTTLSQIGDAATADTTDAVRIISAAAAAVVVDDESSLVTETLD